VAEREVEERKDYLKDVGSGQEHFRDTLYNLVDGWIEILNDKEERQKDSKKGANDLRTEADIA
jgi:hypothetical protein